MTAVTKVETIGRFAASAVTSAPAACDDTCGHDTVRTTVTPLALRADEISEADFDLLYRIAENPGGPGRLRRPAGPIPAVRSSDG